MPPTNLSARLDEKLIEFSSQLDATLEHGRNFGADDVEKKKGSKIADAAAVGAVGGAAGAAGAYVHGVKTSGGNAKGADAMRIGARDAANRVVGPVKSAVKAGGMKTGGFLSKAGKAVTKVAKKFDSLERITSFSEEVDAILNFETIDNATPKKPVQKQKAPNHAALVGVGMGTAGAAAGYAGGMRHKAIMKSGTKHAAQIGKATGRGITLAKTGYKAGTSKMASVGAGIMGNLSKLRRG